MNTTNSSMQSLLMTADVTQVGTQQIHLSSELKDGQSAADGDFWAMLSDNLSEMLTESDGQIQVTSGNHVQLIDNQDLLLAFSEFQAEMGNQVSESAPGQWMQFLKSHFSELMDESAVTDTSLDTEEVQHILPATESDPETLVALYAPNLVDGDELPPVRQPVTEQMAKTAEVSKPVAVQLNTDAAVEPDNAIKDPKTLLISEKGQNEASVKNPVDMIQTRAAMPGNEAAIVKGVETVATTIQSGIGMTNPLTNSGSQLLPTEMQTLSLSTTSNSHQMANALGDRVAFLINHRLNSAEIRLDPPHLGKLDIQIQLKDDSATVVIHTQQAQTRDMIENSSLRLREILQEAGYSSVDVNVSHQESSSQQQMAGEGGSGSNNQQASAQGDEVTVAENHFERASMTLSDGRIDYFA